MIDIHAHILPGVDDGAKTMEDSLEMISQAADSGVEIICATPHILDGITLTLEEKINRTFQLLHSRVIKRKLDIKLMLGSEIYLREDMRSLSGFSFFSLNQTGKYVLVEMPLGRLPTGVDRVIYALKLENITPIIAHPERSLSEMNQLESLRKLIHLGALTQINAGSFLGQFGKPCRKMAESLLGQNLVHVVASDAHDPYSRPATLLRQAFNKVIRLSDEKKAGELFVQNPLRILKGERLFEGGEEANRADPVAQMEVGPLRNQE
jgi:protein-tyrosine phosphatase